MIRDKCPSIRKIVLEDFDIGSDGNVIRSPNAAVSINRAILKKRDGPLIDIGLNLLRQRIGDLFEEIRPAERHQDDWKILPHLVTLLFWTHRLRRQKMTDDSPAESS
jgi:hypothetical protein